jgi:branched-chain amino acid transport system permease protein
MSTLFELVILNGSQCLLVSLSFYLIYKVATFLNFSHAIVFTLAMYLCFLFVKILAWFWVLAIPLSIILALSLGCISEAVIFKPLRKKHSSSQILLLASLGIYIVLQNVISMAFGDDTKSIRTWPVVEGINVFGARITPVQIIIIATSIVIVTMIGLFLHYSKTGKAMRAVANDPELANISGINSDRVILQSFAIGSALAGIAGILVALDVDMTPTMGMNALMMGVVAMIIGGVGSIWGIVLGSLLLALAQNFAVWYISSQWQDAIAFAILLIFLLFKPEGFFGKKLKKAEV